MTTKRLQRLIVAVVLGLFASLLLLLILGGRNALSAPLPAGPIFSITKQAANNWSKRIRLDFGNTVAEDLQDFPVLVVLNSSRINYNDTQDAGQDIRFVDADDTLLPHEIELWNESGNSYIWVRVPQIDGSSTSDYIWMYYGNASALDAQAPENVWNASYRAVWHLDANYLDATANNNHGSAPPANAPSNTTGQFSGGQLFNNSDGKEFINVGSLSSLDNLFNGGATLSAWIRPVGWGPNEFGRILDKSSTFFANDGWGWQLHGNERQTIRFERGFGSSNDDRGAWRAITNAITLNQWQFVAVTYQDTSTANDPILYVNGVPHQVSDGSVIEEETPVNSAASDAAETLYIGNFSGPDDRTFDGTLDEIRIAATIRSSDWISAQFKATTDDLISYNTPEDVNIIPGATVAGAPFTYTLYITNTGDIATNVVVSDTLPIGSNYQSGGTYLPASNSVNFAFSTIGAGQTVTASFVVTTCELGLLNQYYRVLTSTEAVGSALGPPLLSLLSRPTINASFDRSAQNIAIGDTVAFTSTSTTNGSPIVNYQWNFGDGMLASSTTTSHTYPTAGTYTVTLTLTDSCGFTDSVQSTVSVHIPNLTLTKIAAPNPVAASDRLTYTIILSNGTSGNATGVVVSDTLPAGVQFINDSVTIMPAAAGGIVGSPPAIASNLTVHANSSVTITFAVTVSALVADGTILTNTVSATSNQVPAPVTAIATTTVQNPLVLSITKQALNPGFIIAGLPFTYTITVSNSGLPTATNIVVTETLPSAANYITSDGTLVSSDTISWVIASLASQAQQTLTFVVSTCQTSLFNDAYRIVSSDQSSNGPFGPPQTTLLSTPTISPSFTYAPLIGTIASTINFTASGTTTGLPLSQWLWDFGDGITATGTTASHSYSAAGMYAVALTATDGCGFSNTVTNTIPIETVPLTITKSATPEPVQPGQRITYTITVNNGGNFSATGAVISDSIPANTTFVPNSVTLAPGGGVVAGPPLLVTDLTIPAGQSITVTFAVTVNRPLTDGVIITNTAAITGDQTPLPSSDSVTSTVDAVPAIAITKDGPLVANVGQTLIFTFTVTNPGDSLLQVAAIEDNIAGPATFVGGDDGDTWLELTESWLYTASYTIQPDDSDPLTNTVSITATDGTGANVTANASHSTNLSHRPALTITKNGPPTALVGQTIIFTFVVQHAATSDNTPLTNVGVVDNFAGFATLVDNGNGDTILEAGETWVYTAAYTILPTTPNPFTNIGTVVARDLDNDVIMASNSHTTQLAGFNPVLFVDKDGPASANPGDILTYTFTVVNATPASILQFNLGLAALFNLGDGSPIALSSVSDSIAGPGTYISGDDNLNDLLDGAEGWQYIANYTVTQADLASDPLQNTVIVLGTDQEADSLQATDSHNTDILHGPLLEINRTGPTSALVGQTVFFTFTVSHAAGSDNSPVSLVSVQDSLDSSVQLIGGDANANSQLDGGEVWSYATDYTVKVSDPNPVVGVSSVQSRDMDNDLLMTTDIYTITTNSIGLRIFFPLIFKQ